MNFDCRKIKELICLGSFMRSLGEVEPRQLMICKTQDLNPLQTKWTKLDGCTLKMHLKDNNIAEIGAEN